MAGSPPGRRGRVTRADAQRAREDKRREQAAALDVLDDDPDITAAEDDGPDPGEPGGEPESRAARLGRAAIFPVGSAAALEGAAAGIALIPAWPLMLAAMIVFTLGTAGATLVRAARSDDAAGRRYLAAALGSVAWTCIAVPVGFPGVWELLFRAAPVAGSAVIVRAGRRALPAVEEEDPEPALELAAPAADPQPVEDDVPKEDPRLTAFRRVFCQADFAGMMPYGWELLGDNGERGFRFRFMFDHDDPAGSVTAFDTPASRVRMALMWNMTPDRISIEHDTAGPLALNPSEARGVITARRAVARASGRVSTYDPFTSTWNHATGTVECATYASGRPAHWTFADQPFGGTVGGLVLGRSGKGKSAFGGNILMTQLGLATYNGQRIGAPAIGDSQGSSLPHWAPNAPLYAAGALATVHLCRILLAIAKARLEWNRTHEFTIKGRTVTGRGWSAPEPGWPIIMGYISEAGVANGKVELDARHRQELSALELALAREPRKVCVSIIMENQDGYADGLGGPEIREALSGWNKALFDAGEATASQVGIRQIALPPGWGHFQLASRDDNLGEYASAPSLPYADEHGTDAWDVAGQIGETPIFLGDAAEEAMKAYGWDGSPSWVITDEDCIGYEALIAADAMQTATAEAQVAAADTIPVIRPALPVQQVMDVMMNLGSNGRLTTAQIVHETGCSQADVIAACALLAHQGQLAALGGDAWGRRAAA
jgi:hypothetical protein